MADAENSKLYPAVGFHFLVKISRPDLPDADMRFQEVSGLTAELETETLAEGGENRFSHRLPGRGKYPNLVLKRGLITESKLVEWFQDSVQNLDIKPASVLVSLLNEKHVPIITWNLVDVWPVKWSVSNFNAQNNAVAVDTIEMSYKYFTRDEG